MLPTSDPRHGATIPAAMRVPRAAAREISYAETASGRGARALIRLMENATGRLGLIRRASGYEQEVAAGRDFWRVMMECYGLRLDVARGSLENIPADGPLVVVANHPYGILDGLVLGHVLSAMRRDFRILAHQVFLKAPDLGRNLLPVHFDDTRAALDANLSTRRAAIDFLAHGGAVGVFPGGTVSTAPRPLARPMDPAWRRFTARMIARSGAAVVPVYFHGHTSRLFQLASHLNATLRMGLLVKEFRSRLDGPVTVSIGQPIPPAEIAARKNDAREMMDFLREATYELSPKPLRPCEYGFEFEQRHKTRG